MKKIKAPKSQKEIEKWQRQCCGGPGFESPGAKYLRLGGREN